MLRIGGSKQNSVAFNLNPPVAGEELIAGKVDGNVGPKLVVSYIETRQAKGLKTEKVYLRKDSENTEEELSDHER
jgi:hypothetical protein